MSGTPFASRQTSPAAGRRSMIRLALLASVAISIGAIVPAHAADSAVESVERFGTSLVTLTQTGGMPFVQRFAQFAPSVDRAFDLGSILRTSVGGHWETMNPSDQSDLMRIFREYTIANFVASFDKYKGAFQVTGERDAVRSERVVDSKIGDATLGFVMREGSDGWRVVDILADGTISRVATQRSDFRSTLLHGGGPALVASLQRKVSSLSGGSLA